MIDDQGMTMHGIAFTLLNLKLGMRMIISTGVLLDGVEYYFYISSTC